jgi:sec-independent protein translocase protein TatB
MFDVGFSELMVIGVVALIVIGPEKLPRVARTVGHLLGRLQRYVSEVKSEVGRELQIEDLKKLQQKVAEEAASVEKAVDENIRLIESRLNKSITQDIADKPAETSGANVPAPASPDAYADKPKV